MIETIYTNLMGFMRRLCVVFIQYVCSYRFDIVGIYVVMFLEILYTLLRVLMIFSILIVAFGLAFYILLSNVSQPT